MLYHASAGVPVPAASQTNPDRLERFTHPVAGGTLSSEELKHEGDVEQIAAILDDSARRTAASSTWAVTVAAHPHGADGDANVAVVAGSRGRAPYLRFLSSNRVMHWWWRHRDCQSSAELGRRNLPFNQGGH